MQPVPPTDITLQDVRLYTADDVYFYTVDNRPIEDLDYNVRQLLGLADSGRRGVGLATLAASSAYGSLFSPADLCRVGVDAVLDSPGSILQVGPGVVLREEGASTTGSTFSRAFVNFFRQEFSLPAVTEGGEIYYLVVASLGDLGASSSWPFEDPSNPYLPSAVCFGNAAIMIMPGVEDSEGSASIPTPPEGLLPLHVIHKTSSSSSVSPAVGGVPPARFRSDLRVPAVVSLPAGVFPLHSEGLGEYYLAQGSEVHVDVNVGEVGEEAFFEQVGSSRVRFSAGSGVSIGCSRPYLETRGPGSVVSLRKTGPDQWTLSGDTYSPRFSVPRKISAVSRNFSPADVGEFLLADTSEPSSWTIPSMDVGFSVGDEIHLQQFNVGQLTIQGAAEVEVDPGPGFLQKLKGKGAVATLKMIEENVWSIYGLLEAGE